MNDTKTFQIGLRLGEYNVWQQLRDDSGVPIPELIKTAMRMGLPQLQQQYLNSRVRDKLDTRSELLAWADKITQEERELIEALKQATEEQKKLIVAFCKDLTAKIGDPSP